MPSNDYGRFDSANREYVITNPDTPSPWVNYLMGRNVTAIVSQAAGGLAFYKEPSEGRLTRYRFNGLPADSPGFYLYIQDGNTTWAPSFRPTRTTLDRYECRHGLGYTRFASGKKGVACDVTYLIPQDDDVFLWSVRLTNNTKKTKRLKLSTYVEFSLHQFMKDTLFYLVGGLQWRVYFDPAVNGIKTDHFNFETLFPGQCIFASSEPVAAFDTDRDRFIGPGRTEANPVGLEDGPFGSQLTDGGAYACGVLQNEIALKPGASRHVLFKYAVSDRFAESARLVGKYQTEADVDKALAKTRRFWDHALATAQVETPDSAVNEMLNTWLPYNALVTFRYARSISTRHTGSGGALRYRDSMQDAMPAVQLFPGPARERILRILQTMWADGHTLYAVNPETLKPNNERAEKIVRSDAAVWGVFTVYEYLAETGDFAFLDEVVPYYDAGEGTVFEHLYRSLRFIAQHTGKDGLPDLFNVDWCDFLQIFTNAYTGGQSVMVAEQFIAAARLLMEMCDRMGRSKEKAWLRRASRRFTDVLNSDTCWDGKWFRRVLADDLVLGTKKGRYAKLFLNTQTWAALAGTLDQDKVRMAMDSVHRQLNTEYGLRLFRPPFAKMPDGRTRLPANTPGCGENGGIFVHANTWAVMAEALLGNADRAWEYFSKILPPNLSAKGPDRFASAPYAFVSWIFGPDHSFFGRGQYSWITGGTAWMYLAGLQYILGVRPTLDGLLIAPCVPPHWDGYRVTRKYRGATYRIDVRKERTGRPPEITVNGKPVDGRLLPILPKGKRADVCVIM